MRESMCFEQLPLRKLLTGAAVTGCDFVLVLVRLVCLGLGNAAYMNTYWRLACTELDCGSSLLSQ